MSVIRRIVLLVALVACLFAHQSHAVTLSGSSALSPSRGPNPFRFTALTAAAWGSSSSSSKVPPSRVESRANAFSRQLTKTLNSLRIKIDNFVARLTPDNVFSTVIYASVMLYVGTRMAEVGESFHFERIGTGFSNQKQPPVRFSHKMDW